MKSQMIDIVITFLFHLGRVEVLHFFLIKAQKILNEMKCDNVKWKMWWYEEDFECIRKQKCK